VMEHGEQLELQHMSGFDPEGIQKTVKTMLEPVHGQAAK
jgi:hypothetical protein